MVISIWSYIERVSLRRSFHRYAFSKYDMDTYLKIPGPPLEPILGNARHFAGSLRKFIPLYLGMTSCSSLTA